MKLKKLTKKTVCNWFGDRGYDLNNAKFTYKAIHDPNYNNDWIFINVMKANNYYTEESFDKKEVEVVMPFTYGVKFNGAGTEYAYLGKEGTVEIGDLLLKTDGTKGITIGQVTAVNTKSEKANKYFDGVKIKTEQLDQ